VEIHFDTSARICGASTVNYLLEKSRYARHDTRHSTRHTTRAELTNETLASSRRVVYQIKGERNFHIFYQLVAGLDQETLAKWNLKSAEHYNYINTSGCITIDGVDDAKDFEEVKEGTRPARVVLRWSCRVGRVVRCCDDTHSLRQPWYG
jgi:myosin heavy subunit